MTSTLNNPAGDRQERERLGLAALLALAFLIPASTAWAQLGPADGDARYRSCLQNAREKPEDTFETATAWIGGVGSEQARHCAAVALIEMGHYEEAARRLEALVQDLPPNQLAFQGALLAQAGQSWLLADDLDRAYRAQTAALEADPGNAVFLTDRGITLASAGHFEEAVADFSRAAAAAPHRNEIFVYRASAYRYLGQPGLAAADLESVLERDPDNADALLERGMLRREEGNEDGARDDWVRAALIAEGTPTGILAQRNLEKLDVTPD